MPLVDWAGLGKGLSNAAQGAAHNLQMGLVNTVNRAGEVTYDAAKAIHDRIAPPQPEVDYFAQRGFPSYMTDANQDWERKALAQNYLEAYDPKTLPKQMPQLAVYRADPTGKFGGKDGLETIPTRFGDNNHMNLNASGEPVEIYAYARGLARGQRYGVPQLSAQQLAAMALKEGRTNFGHNSYDHNNPASNELVQKMAGGPDQFGRKVLDGDVALEPIKFAATVAEKMAVAKRLGIPFEEAWNGTGRNDHGTTGAQYARGFQAYLKAAQNPKNKPLVDLIQSALDAERPHR